MIGQRLFTGRVAVAQASLEFARSLFSTSKEYTDQKMVWTPKGNAPLSSIPQLKFLYSSAFNKIDGLEQFVAKCEKALCVHLKAQTLPTIDLVEAIAVAKVMAVEQSISLCTMLKNEVGSYALMAGTGFDQMDFLQCCKFAEGDSRILMQKMARDRMKAFTKSDPAAHATEVDPHWSKETTACYKLQSAVARSVAAGNDVTTAWDESYDEVYAVAAEYMHRVVTEF